MAPNFTEPPQIEAQIWLSRLTSDMASMRSWWYSLTRVRGSTWNTCGVPITSSSQVTPSDHMSYGQVRFSALTPVQYLHSVAT